MSQAESVARVVIYSGEGLYGLGLKAALESVGALRVVALESNPRTVSLSLDSHDFEIAVWDCDLEPHELQKVVAEFRQRKPGSAFVAWMSAPSRSVAARLIEDGVKAILPKTASVAIVVDCLLKVANGGVWLEPSLEAAILEMQRPRLSRREGELVRLVTAGLSNKEIAAELCITEGTVKVYLSKLFRKVNVEDRLELAMYGVRNFGLGLAERTHVPHHPVMARAMGAAAG